MADGGKASPSGPFCPGGQLFRERVELIKPPQPPVPCIVRLSVVDRNPVCGRDLYPVVQYRWFPSDAASFVTFSKHFGTMQKPLHSPHWGTFSPQVQNQVDGNLIVYRCLNYFIKRIPNASALEDKQTKTAPNNALIKPRSCSMLRHSTIGTRILP